MRWNASLGNYPAILICVILFVSVYAGPSLHGHNSIWFLLLYWGTLSANKILTNDEVCSGQNGPISDIKGYSTKDQL